MVPHFGLENATVSRALIITSGLCSLALGTLKNGQAQLRIASAFGFSRQIDVVISIFLLFLLGRSVERRRGSRTFGGQIIATAGFLAACRPVLQRTMSGYTDGLLAVTLIATLFVPYAVHVPPVQRYSVLNFSFTDKSRLLLELCWVSYTNQILLIYTASFSFPGTVYGFWAVRVMILSSDMPQLAIQGCETAQLHLQQRNNRAQPCRFHSKPWSRSLQWGLANQ